MKPISVVVPDGSMQQVVMDLLAKAGMQIKVGKRTKKGEIDSSFINKLFFLRPQEIPLYLNAGNFDLAIVGEDWIANWGFEFPVLLKLPIGRSGDRKAVKIVLAVSKDSGISQVEDLPQGCEVATEYVELSEKFFASKNRSDIRILRSWGGTEQRPRFGAMAIVDITESGESLRANNLVIIGELMESNTVLVANPGSLVDESKKEYIGYFTELVKGAFEAPKYVLLTADVPKEVLNEAARLMGGVKGPTCSPIYGRKDWFALQSFIPKDKEGEIMFALKKIGATGIFPNRDIPLIMF